MSEPADASAAVWDGYEDDETVQRLVLGQAFGAHPDPLTITEMVRDIAAHEAKFSVEDAIKRATHDLVAVGLLYLREDEFVQPTRAALRFHELTGRTL
jgi:hypothetical protein